MQPSDDSTEPGGESGSTWPRRLARWSGLALVGVIALLVAGLLLLQFDSVATAVARQGAALASSPELRVEVEGASGTWISGLGLDGVRVVSRAEGAPHWELHVDSLRADYALLPLLRRRVRIDRLRIEGVEGWIRLLETGPDTTPPPASEPGTTWQVELGRAVLGIEEFRVHPPSEGPVELASDAGAPEDSASWVLSGARVAVRDVHLVRELSVALDTLEASFQPPGREDGWGSVMARGAVGDGVIRLDTLAVRSPVSRVGGAGRLPLRWSGTAPEGVDFDIGFAPLHLGDMGPLLPSTLPDSLNLRAHVRARSESDTLLLEGEADGGELGRAEFSAGVSGARERPTSSVSVTLREVALEPLGLTPRPVLLDGTVRADITGATASELRGEAILDLEVADPGGPLDGSLALEARSDSADGAWTGRWRVASREVAARGSARIRPSSTPEWSLDGRATWASSDRGDSTATAPATPLAVRWAGGGFEAEGRGFSPDSVRARLALTLDSLRTDAGGRIGPVRTRVDLEQGQARLEVDGRAGGGGVSIRAEGDLREATARLLSARLDSVDVASLIGDTVPSRVSAVASGRLQEVDPLRISGDARITELTWGPRSLDSARVTFTRRGSESAVGAEAHLPDSGRVAMRGRIVQRNEGLRVELDTLTWQHLDLRALADATGDGGALPSTDLSGSGQGRVTRRSDGWAGSGTLALITSRVGDATVESARVVASVRGDSVAATLAVASTAGALDGEMGVSGLGAEPRLVIPGLRFSHLEPGAFMAGSAPEVSLTGRLEGVWQGGAPDTGRGRISLRLDDSRAARVVVDSAQIDAEVEEGRLTAELQVGSDQGRLSLTAEAAFAEPRPAWQVTGAYARAGEGTPGDPRVDLRFGGEGAGTRPDSLDGELWLQVDSAHWGGEALEGGEVRLALQQGVLRVDTAALHVPGGELTARGRIPLREGNAPRGELEARVELEGADALQGFAPETILGLGTARVEARVEGSLLDAPTVDAEARLSSVLVGQTRAQGIDVTFQGRRTPDQGWVEGEGRLEVDRLGLPTAQVASIEVDGSLEGEEVRLRGDALIDARRNVQVAARIERLPRPSSALVESFEFTVDDDLWTLDAPARLTFGDSIRFGTDSLTLSAGDQRLWVAGALPASGPIELEAGASAFEISTVADLVGYPALRGRVDARLAVAGTVADPRIDARVDTRLTPEGVSPAHLRLTMASDSVGVAVNGRVELDEGGVVEARGRLPVRIALDSTVADLPDDATLRLSARSDSFPLAWLAAVVPPSTASQLGGTLHGSVEAQGSAGEPELSGELVLADGAVRLPALGVRYEQGRARVAFDGRTIRLDSLRLATGDGSLSAGGTLTLPGEGPPRYEARFRADAFKAVETTMAQATLSGDLGISGEGRDAAITGSLDVERADLYLGDLASGSRVEEVELTEADYDELARVFGYRPPSQRPTTPPLLETTRLDVQVRLGRASWVRQRANPKLAVQFSGELSVQKAPTEELELLGSVEAVPERSYVEQFGRRFSIAQGELTFQGPPQRTRVDLTAEYEVPSRANPGEPEVVLALEVTGTPDDLELELSSRPTLEASDMVSYLVTGRPASESLSGGGEGSLQETGGALALGRLSGAVEAYAREEVGLDVVEIITEGLDGVTLLAGRYVSPDLYLGVRQPISLERSATETSQSSPTPEIEVELQALRWLLLNLRAGGRAGTEFFVRSRFSYE